MASSYLNNNTLNTGRKIVDEYLDYKEGMNDDHNENNNHSNNPSQLQNHSNNQQHHQNNANNQHRQNNANNHPNNQNHSNHDPNYNGFMHYQEDQGQHNTNSGQNSQKSLSLEYGKSIKLLRNGDEFYRGQKYVINSRKYRYLDVFLDDISDHMNANFGAVRAIHTPTNGHRVKNLDEFEDGKTYVAAGSGRFVRLNYLDISEGKRNPPTRLPALTRHVDYNNINIPQYDKSQNVIIYVYRNGDIVQPPAKILLHKNTLASYDAVLNEITAKVHLTNGAVLNLFTMEGEKVVSSTQLVSGSSYVGANKERFKRCDYLAAANAGSPRSNRKPFSLPVSHISSTSGNKSNNVYLGKPYAGWHKELPPLTGPKPASNTSNYTSNTNNSLARRNEKKLNVDRDEGGIYKARNNQENARIVDDNHEMYVDVPVDYRKAKEVQEDIRDNRQAGNNQLSKPNSKPPPQQHNRNAFDYLNAAKDEYDNNENELETKPQDDQNNDNTQYLEETEQNNDNADQNNDDDYEQNTDQNNDQVDQDNDTTQYLDETEQNNDEVQQNNDSLIEDDDEAVQNEEQVVQNDDEVVQNDDEVVQNDDEVVQNEEQVVQNDDEVVQNEEQVVQNEEQVVQNEEEVVQNDDEIVQNVEEVIRNDEEVVQNDDNQNIEQNNDNTQYLDELEQIDDVEAGQNNDSTQNKEDIEKNDQNLNESNLEEDNINKNDESLVLESFTENQVEKIQDSVTGLDNQEMVTTSQENQISKTETIEQFQEQTQQKEQTVDNQKAENNENEKKDNSLERPKSLKAEQL